MHYSRVISVNTSRHSIWELLSDKHSVW